MTTLANNSRLLSAATTDGPSLIGCRFVLGWTCTRRARESNNGSALERVQLVMSVQPLDRQHAMLEAWMEPGGTRVRTLLQSTSRPCVVTNVAGLIHLDVPGADGHRLLALSIASDSTRIVYAQSSQMREAGLAAGAYDPPSLQRVTDERIAESA